MIERRDSMYSFPSNAAISPRPFGIVDICTLLLILLPLYPYQVESGYIYCVSLLEYTNTTSFICWGVCSILILIGFLKIVETRYKIKKYTSFLTMTSLGLSIFLVLFLALSRIAYAIVMAFVLFLIKVFLFVKYMK